MGMELFDPQIHNVAILSEQHSLAEVERDFVTDPFARWLVPKASFLGWTIVWLYYICEVFGWCDANENLQTVLKVAQLGIAQLKRTLAESEGGPLPSSSFLSLSFDERWQDRFRKVDRLLNGESEFPSFEKIQRVVAPCILQEITRSPIPWDIFDSLLHQNVLDGGAEIQLQEWIQDVELWGACISPFLLFSLCDAAVCRTFPDESSVHKASYVFFLAWSLYKAGLSILPSSDGSDDATAGFLPSAVGQEKVAFGVRLPVSFPTNVPICAHDVEGYPQFMALTSASPLLLGMWMHNINECPPVIPCVSVHSCDLRGRYVIIDHLLASLEEDVWEKEGCTTEHDMAVLENVCQLGKMLLSFSNTINLERDHLFLTSTLEIRSLTPLEERYPFFSLLYVERFLRAVCCKDQERLRQLFHRIGIMEHPASQMYRSLITKFLFEATDPDIHRELVVYGLDDRNFQDVSDWVHTLQRHVRRIREIQKDNPLFFSLSPKGQTSVLVHCILHLQEEMGWVSYVPKNLTDIAVAWLEQQAYNLKGLSGAVIQIFEGK